MTEVKKDNGLTGLEIAVIGAAGRFPGANNLDQFWDNLKNGVESITFFSDDELQLAGVEPGLLKNPEYVKARGIINNIEYFDAAFFGYLPTDAQIMDPQVRLFHECVWEALENAGYDPNTYKGLIGLFAGASPNMFWEALTYFSSLNQDTATQFTASHLSEKDYLTTQISYKLNLKGPSIAIQTACSTSLVAVHIACTELLTGSCDIALAGGVSISLPQKSGYLYQEGMILSPDGHCRAFDEQAHGTVIGEGAGVIVLKRFEDALEDRDNIIAVIKGSGINNDGLNKIGFTAPSVEGQAQLIKTVQYLAGIDPETIGYIEAHGTGTELGDPIEFEALKIAFHTAKRNYCALGSVKTNIGHLDNAAGIAGLIKTILALQHRQIPPMLHFQTANPKIDFEHSPFFVNPELYEWAQPNRPFIAGVSSFGIGGTNAHVVLEEAPKKEKSAVEKSTYLFTLSAKTPTALDKVTENLTDYLQRNQDVDLADVTYTLQVGRAQFDYRRAVICSNVKEAIDQLSHSDITNQVKSELKKIVFMFPGQGSQYLNMGLELYQKVPAFRDEVDRCLVILKSLIPIDIKEILYPGDKQVGTNYNISDTYLSQPIIFMFEYSLAQLLIKWGIKPDILIGHSIGEYVAACLAGVFSLEDALSIVVFRGELMQKIPHGTMLSVPLTEAEIGCYLSDEIALAAINTSSSCVLSGNSAVMETLEKHLLEIGRHPIRLQTSHAFHSKMMEPILQPFTEKLKTITFNKPRIPFLSNVTGQWIMVQDATNPEYWAKHLRETVRFNDALTELLRDAKNVLIEVGPGRTLSNFVKQHQDYKQGQSVINLVKGAQEEISDYSHLLKQLGRLWCIGIKIDWAKFYKFGKRNRVVLPTYPFERERFWIEGNPFTNFKDLLNSFSTPIVQKNAIKNWCYFPSWERSRILPYPNIKQKLGVVFINDHHFVKCLTNRLQRELEKVVIVKIGTTFERLDENTYSINPSDKYDYQKLCAHLYNGECSPELFVHLWNVTEDIPSDFDLEMIRQNQAIGFYSFLYLSQALANYNKQSIELVIISNNIHEIIGNEVLDPGKSMLLGPCKVIPQENWDISCRSIDIIPPKAGNKQEEEKLINSLVGELFSDLDEPMIAYRNGHRWIQVYKPLNLEKEFTLDTVQYGKFKKNGVYLITGGLGKMGLLFAKFLVEKYAAKIILISHSKFPVKDEWNQWLDNFNSNHPVCEKILKIKAIEAFGTEVLIYQANLMNIAEMAKIIENSEERLGEINAVIHAAGVTIGNSINEIEPEECEKHFQAKVYGLMGLAQVFKHKNLDFCMTMSSLAAILGGAGFIAYSSANIFMDLFIQKLNQKSSFPWISINWDAWDFGDNQIINGDIKTEFTDLAINPNEGLEIFERMLAIQNVNQVIISTSSLFERFNKWIKIDKKKPANQLIQDNTQIAHQRPNLSNPYLKPETEIEEKLTMIWGEILGFSQIGTGDNFFELGGDSLKVMILRSKIFKDLNVEIPLREIFTLSNIKELANFIDQTERNIYHSINRVEERKFYPVSSAQKRLYVLEQLEQVSTSYNMPGVFEVEGRIVKERLEETFRQLINRHESFRTSFGLVEGEPVQWIHPEVEFRMNYQELDSGESDIQETISLIIQEFIQPFDLSKAPLVRAGLVKTSENRFLLMFDIHHIIADGASMIVLIRDFAAIYNGERLADLRIQYKEYSEWQNRLFQNGGMKKQEEYWLRNFQGEIPVLKMPTDYERPAYRSFEGEYIEFGLNEELTSKLKQMAIETETTLNIFILAVYNVLLSKYSGQDDIVVGVLTTGRPHVDLEGIVGVFINTLPIRNYPKGGKTFREFLAEVKDNTLNGYENQAYQFEKLIERLELPTDRSRNPLFDTMIIMQNLEQEEIRMPEFQLTPYRIPQNTTKFDFMLQVFDYNTQIGFCLDYCKALFKNDTMVRFTQGFINIMQEVLDDPDLILAKIETIASEKEHIQNYFNEKL